MPFFLKVLVVTLLGTALGLLLTEAAVERGFLFGRVAQGPWTAWPATGSPKIDPYARAVLARTGLVPMSSDEGLAFLAANDAEGRPLEGACDYALEGPDPAARFWSLGLFDPRGDVTANAVDRYALTSQDVVRLDNKVGVAVSAIPQPGNWLPAPSTGRFTLLLSLYESTLGAALSSKPDFALFQLRRVACR